ncbi:MAG: rhomboid family intramembrane serine protease [Nanoarchaeota archaeon]
MRFRFYAIKLCIIIILVFLVQIFISAFSELFVLNELSWSQPWRFISSIFLHGGLAHLVLNLFALMLFGSILEKLIGGRRFLIVFFITGIIANLISINFYSSSLGASGAIFGIIGALIFIRPMMIVWAFGMPMPIFVAGILWTIGDILGAYGFFSGNPIDNTGNLAHISGIVFGLLFGAQFRRVALRRRRV